VNRENRTKRLYQWLTQRASFFRFDGSGRGTSRTVRTEVTLERESVTLSVNGPAFDLCPMCGQTLRPPQAGRRLEEGSTTGITTDEFQYKLSPRKNPT